MSNSIDFNQIVHDFSPNVREIAIAIRALIFEVFPEVVEVPWVVQQVIGYGTGPKKMSEHFCWIQPNKAHVNLGFNYGTELVNLDHLLEGTGKRFRHIKMRLPADVARSGVRSLLEQACKHRVLQLKRSLITK